MEFGIPPLNEEVDDFPLKSMPPQLRADGNLDYRQFITLVKNLWKEVHPDIPIRPVQSQQYSKYPVIVYGLELRKPMNAEPKKRFRTLQHQVDEEHHLRITAQRFDNVVTFTVITENNPDMCEAIIETFEDFMAEYTPVFKQYGVSEFLYVRRLPDRENTRPDEDVEERSVAYQVTLEKIIVTELDKLNEIVIRATTQWNRHWYGVEFWAFHPDDDPDATPSNDTDTTLADYLTTYNHPYMVGDLIVLRPPNRFQDPQANIPDLEFTIPDNLPRGLFADYLYQIYEVTRDTIKIQRVDGEPVPIFSQGMGIIAGASDTSALVHAEYIDEFQTATPNY